MDIITGGVFIRIITVNLPQSYLKAIDSLVGQEGLYPSRSELIRVALRDFLIKELESAKSMNLNWNQVVTTHPPSVNTQIDSDLYVQVPLNDTEFKTYRLVKR